MADFCKQCSLVLFGADHRDLAETGCTAVLNAAGGYDMRPDWKDGEPGRYIGSFSSVLCEGCGPIQVDADGNCVSGDCDGEHRKAIMDGVVNVEIS